MKKEEEEETFIYKGGEAMQSVFPRELRRHDSVYTLVPNCNIEFVHVIVDPCVTGIENSSFLNHRNLISVRIPFDSVTYIGNGAFCDCRSLRSIDLPNSLVRIGGGAFRNCVSLTSIKLPDSLRDIDAYAFWGCTGLVHINLPSSLTKIWENAFVKCPSLKSIDVPLSSLSILVVARYNLTPLSHTTINQTLGKLTDVLECKGLVPILIPQEQEQIRQQQQQIQEPKTTEITSIYMNPKITVTRGRVALSVAAERGIRWEEGLEKILELNMPAIEVTDPVTGLEPFMLAAAGGGPRMNVETIFLLLKEYPAAISCSSQQHIWSNPRWI